MTNIPPATGLNDEDKEYNWTVILPVIALFWTTAIITIGLMRYKPDLFIKCYQLICCCRKLPEEQLIIEEQTAEESTEVIEDLAKKLTEIKAKSLLTSSNQHIPSEHQYKTLDDQSYHLGVSAKSPNSTKEKTLKEYNKNESDHPSASPSLSTASSRVVTNTNSHL